MKLGTNFIQFQQFNLQGETFGELLKLNMEHTVFSESRNKIVVNSGEVVIDFSHTAGEYSAGNYRPLSVRRQ